MAGETTDARKRRLEREAAAAEHECGICLPGDYCPITGKIHGREIDCE